MTTPGIDNLLRRAGRALLLADLAGGLLNALVTLAMALGAVVLIDAGFALHRYGLAAMDTVLIALLLTFLWRVGIILYRARFKPRRVAVTIEQRLSIPDNKIINALDLAQQDGLGISDELRLSAIEQGEALAHAVAEEPVIDRNALRRSIRPAAISVAVLLLAYLIVPSLFNAVLPRLFAPFADHPPFTFVRFDIQTEPGTIYIGQPATIRVTLTGPTIPEQAEIVFVDDGVKSPPLPMFRAQPHTDDSQADQDAGFYLIQIERAEASRGFYINTPLGRSRIHTLTVDTSPQLEQAHVAYHFPAYTGWSDTAAPLKDSGIRALTGTQITLQVTSNVPLASGELIITVDGISTQAQNFAVQAVSDPIDPRVALAQFDLTRSGQFELTLQGTDGTTSDIPLVGELSALPDRAPKIDIIHPDRQVVVPEGWQIEAKITAGDDIAVGSVFMHHRLNDAKMTATDLSDRFAGRGKTVAQAAYPFDLTTLGAKPGDAIHYFAIAYDNHPGSPQSVETPTHTIHIISMQQYLDLARSQYRIDDLNREFEAYMQQLDGLQAKREALLRQLETLQKELAAGEPLTEDQQHQIDELTAAMEKYTEETLSLFKTLRDRSEQATLYEFENPYKEMLKMLGSQLQQQATGAAALGAAMKALSKADGAEVRARFAMPAEQFKLLKEPFTEEAQEQIQEVEQDIERLRLADALIEQGGRILYIAQMQEDLAIRMSSLGEKYTLSPDQQQRADGLATEQSLLRDELKEAAIKLHDAAEQASGLLPNMSGGAMTVADKIESLRIIPAQSASEKAALAGNMVIAHQASREAADKLDSLLSDVHQNQGQANNDLDGCFKLPRQQLQNALNQMAAGRGLPKMGMPGSSGAGLSGQMGRMSIVGPAIPGNSPSQSRGRPGARGGRGGISENGEQIAEQTEHIDANAVNHETHGVYSLPGVPNEYREQAEAYFKRLAEESR